MDSKEVEPKQMKKGFWNLEEDLLLKQYVDTHGEGKWSTVSQKTGLMRGGKSCRLRWKNYLRPNIKRGMMSQDEEDLIIRMHKLLGNRWALIAGRLPGRTDNEVKNYWNTYLNKKTSSSTSCLQSRKRRNVDYTNTSTTVVDNKKTCMKNNLNDESSYLSKEEKSADETKIFNQDKKNSYTTLLYDEDETKIFNQDKKNSYTTFLYDEDDFIPYLDFCFLFEAELLGCNDS